MDDFFLLFFLGEWLAQRGTRGSTPCPSVPPPWCWGRAYLTAPRVTPEMTQRWAKTYTISSGAIAIR